MNTQEKVIKILMDEQYQDGSFGRFHTMDSKLKQKIPTTEAAAWLMYENFITRQVDVCNKTCLYMERLLDDTRNWPDSWEKNKYFKSAVPLFIASKLALFTSETNEYKRVLNTWISILISAFQTNQYSAHRANEISKQLLGVEIDKTYIGLHSLNCLALFALNTDKIPIPIQKAYLQWLHNFDGKITYTDVEPKNLTNNFKSIRVISLLSKFKYFEKEFPDLI